MRQMLPSLVTAITLACGLAALEAVRVADWSMALWLILLAAVADGVDGRLARQLHATSAMGAQFDSLADVVAFGAAPAFLFATHFSSAPAPLRFGVALIFALAGAYRLARFHAQPREDAFCGLPITAAGPLLAVAVAGPLALEVQQASVIGLALAGLMACHHPFPKPTFSRRWLLAGLTAAVLPLTLWPGIETLAVIAAIAIGGYVAWGLVGQALADAGGLSIRFPEVPGAGKTGR